jgi:hypothetical protein
MIEEDRGGRIKLEAIMLDWEAVRPTEMRWQCCCEYFLTPVGTCG